MGDGLGRTPRNGTRHDIGPTLETWMRMADTFESPPRRSRGEGTLGAWVDAWRERRYVARRCRELLALAEELRVAEPGLAGLPLYRGIVGRTLGGDEAAVDRTLRLAEDNFAAWPVSRALTLRDVAHHIAVSEYFAAHIGRQEMQAELKRIVDDTIPGDL